MEGLTKEYLDKQLSKLGHELKRYSDEQVEKLARIVSSAFEKQQKYMDSRFNWLEQDIKGLHKDHLGLERRVRRLETHANI